MKNIKLILFLAFVAIAAMACRKTEDPGGTAIQEMCGEWQIYVAQNDNDAPIKLLTSNTSDNSPNKIRLACSKFMFNFIATCDLASKTFSATNAPSEYWRSTAYPGRTYKLDATVTDGKITKDGVTLPSGSKADKIEFKIRFANEIDSSTGPQPDDATIYSFIGYRRSGFLEDEDYVYKGN